MKGIESTDLEATIKLINMSTLDQPRFHAFGCSATLGSIWDGGNQIRPPRYMARGLSSQAA